jgi:RND family efflux transporter MFP subunit
MKKVHPSIIKAASLFILIPLILLSACGKKGNTQNIEKNGNGITRVIVEPVQQEPIVRTIKLSGKAEGIVDIDVLADISGRIISLNKKLGDYVKKGDEIGRIESAQYEFAFKQAESQLIASEAGLRSKEMQLKADSLLYAQESISEQGMLNSYNVYQQSLASYKGAQALYEQSKRTLDRAILKAPASGYVAYLPIKVGENISANTVVYTIVDDSQIIVRTGIGQNYINMVSTNDPVAITCNSANLVVKGRVTSVGRSAKIGDSLYPIEISFKNPGQMKSGMILNLELEKATTESMYAIKFSVVEQRYDERFVYVADGENASLRKIVLGDMVGNYVIVTEGLSENDLLIVDSSGKLSDGQPITYTLSEKE